ncbi:uncharacterized protein LOC131016207 [Salvia miltiorrhiza]|uniref:uncharacterized protein LOC131016207 n=1 Tax=Salvia miltiorrhiza TaxID=226208 RepID=UPI0025AB7572|nr:uncharacterized protein LOC131016207 [Salvia miltiorrhiza]
MAKKLVKYCLVDTFAETAFKGNPSSVCVVEEEKDPEWLRNVAREFNQAVTSYLTQSTTGFQLRWFTRDGDEISICGHATLAAAYYILLRLLPTGDAVQLSTLSGIIIARKVPELSIPPSFSIELDFPVLPLEDFIPPDLSQIEKMLNTDSITEIKKTSRENYLLVVVASGEAVRGVDADIGAVRKYPVRGLIVTGKAPFESEYDIYYRFFCPNLGADEDHVCGSAHCALAPYWSQRLGKNDFVSYTASTRGGVIHVHLDEKNERVLIRGRAVAVMEGSILV